MKIKTLSVSNFCGIEGTKDFELKKITSLLGKNGCGKTSLLNGIRFALTGQEPEGDIINANSDCCTVKITIENPATGIEHSFCRTKYRDKPSKFFVDDNASTQKALNETLQELVGLSLDRVKITSSSDLIAAMQPQEFATFVMEYVAKEMTFDEVVSLIPEATLDMISIMEEKLPENGITLDTLISFDDYLRNTRKDIKKTVQIQQALLNSKPTEKPEYDLTSLNERMAVLNNLAMVHAHYLKEKDMYDRAVDAHKKHLAMMADLQKEIDAIPVTKKPDPANLADLENKRKNAQASVNNQKTAIAGVYSAIQQLKITLDALNKPICPISPLITCHQDKTVAKEDISSSIKSSEEGLVALNEELKKAEATLVAAEKGIADFNNASLLFDKREQLQNQLETAKDNTPKVPSEPAKVELVDTTAEQQEIKNKVKTLNDYEEGQKIAAQVAKETALLETYEKLVKAFSEKGIVRTSVVTKYLGVLENVCNTRSQKFRPGISFTFVNENGIKVLMDNGKGHPLPYEALSGGERAYMLFIIMDMLNQLTGSRLLMLDEMNVMDSEVLAALLSIIKDCEGEYDHILLASVNHSDIVDLFKSHGFLAED